MSNPITDRSAAGTPTRRSSAGYVLALLFLGNLLNFYDRQLPAVLLEQIKADFGLDDTAVGILASAFVLVAAIAGVPLGRLADRVARTSVAGVGLVVWSLFTAMGGVFSNFWLFLVSRVGVGIGESSYAPAAGSLIADLYPTEKRARATAIYMLGFPIGLLLAFVTAGAIAVAFGSWQAPFLIAAVPGLVVALLMLRVREPRRGAADPMRDGAAPVKERGALLAVFKVRSIYGLILAFAGYNFAAYSIGTFLIPVLQRYYGLDLITAGLVGGVVIGLTGLLGLVIGGPLLDRAARRSPGARVWLSGILLIAAAAASLVGLSARQGALWQLVVFLGLGYLLGIIYLAASAPAVADVVEPEQRSTALGMLYACGYLLGGAGGPILVGVLSDSLARGSSLPAEAAAAQGLQAAMMILVPIAFTVAGVGMLVSSRSVLRDRGAMLNREVAR